MRLCVDAGIRDVEDVARWASLYCEGGMGLEVDGGGGLMAVNKVAAAMLLSLFFGGAVTGF